MPVVGIAFFDLDKTILSVNSGSLWVRREVALGHLSKRQALKAAAWLARYTLGFASAEQMVADAVLQLRGSDAQPLKDRTTQFYADEVRHTYRPGALQAIDRHRAAGDRLVMLTSSTHYLASLVAEELGFEQVLCNTLEVVDGRHTGKVVGRVCFGAGKLSHALQSAQTFRAELRDAAFYTDSFSDLPVMEAVGRPVAVNPDLRLRRHAARRGWSVVDWGVPGHRAA